MALPPERFVLVIEDDADIRLAVSLVLEQLGVPVRTASNGQEGLAVISGRMPSLILLDMRMPVMDGWEFSRQFRDRYDHGCPVIVLTAAPDAEERSAEIAADGFISKPFRIDQIEETLTRFGMLPTAA